jgi:hypothetical protein
MSPVPSVARIPGGCLWSDLSLIVFLGLPQGDETAIFGMGLYNTPFTKGMLRPSVAAHKGVIDAPLGASRAVLPGAGVYSTAYRGEL